MAILANELRIGNWVKAPLGELLQVKQIGHPEKSDYILADTRFGFGQNEMAGIPLTPEILEKCGFVKQNNGWNINKKWELDDTCFSLFDNNYCNGKLKLTYNIGNGPIPKVKYLHQLQNLYFALTGAELEVKL